MKHGELSHLVCINMMHTMAYPWYSFFKGAIFRPLCLWWFRVKITGIENLPNGGGYILAANHLDIGDVAALPSMVKPHLSFPAKQELFAGKGIGGRIVAWFMKVTGQTSMDRAGGRASASALGHLLKVLEKGQVVAIFPEGTRSPDGSLYKGHTGVARLALAHGHPVVPVGLINTTLVPSTIKIPTMRKAMVVIGKPLDFSAWKGQQNNHAVLRWVTNEVMAAIQELTGQTYVDVYASRVKKGDLKGADLGEYMSETPRIEPAPAITSDVESGE